MPEIINIPVNDVEVSGVVAITDRNNGDSLTIQIPMPSAAAAPESVPQASPAPPAVRTISSAPVAAPVAMPAATAPVARRAPSTGTSTTRQTSSRTINDYWIQIGAYSAMVRAEDVREQLASNGLVSLIENRVVNGQNLYRVRLGPYVSEREANHWLAIVRSIEGFNDSQVRQTIRQQ